MPSMNNEADSMLSMIPDISKKTSNEKLLAWSTQRWQSDATRYVALDIVNNGKELLSGSAVDWNLVLNSIRIVERYNGSTHFGGAAIAVHGGRLIGGLAARAGWSMDNPQSVYLSGKYLANIVNFEDFKAKMTLASVLYAEKTLPQAELLMGILDLLLEDSGRINHSRLVRRIASLLHDGNIQKAYSIVSSR